MSCPDLRHRDTCRLCGGDSLNCVLSLGETPLANEFVTEQARWEPQERFPLDLYLCEGCGHVQLCDVIEPERLFGNYVYVSSTSPVFVEHFRKYAADLLHRTGMPTGSRVLEIGSNDGVLLRAFREAGMQVLGVDPARKIARQATAQGIKTISSFFTRQLAGQIRTEYGPVALVAANNVFAHADDLHDIVDGVADILQENGLFVFEVSYLLDVLEKTLFDTIYHEHLSYHAVRPLVGLFRRHGMELIDVIRVDVHGGSLRGIAARQHKDDAGRCRVEGLVELETKRGVFRVETYRRFAAHIQELKNELVEQLRTWKAQGLKIAGFGAPAKATTLMYHFGIGPELLDYIIDDSPWKQGLYSPGYHLPVVPSSFLYESARKPDIVLVLAWNFAESIMANHLRFLNAGGEFIVPLPRITIRRRDAALYRT